MVRYTLGDWIAVGVFSGVSGVVFAVVSDIMAMPVYALFGHPGIAAIYGFWFIGGTLVGYVVRKPWSAFLGETIGATIELLMLSPYSIMLFYYGPAQGIMSELAFRLRGYKDIGKGTMMLAGALPVITAYPFDCLVSPYYPTCRFYPLELHVLIVGLMLFSGALFGGLLVKLVVDAARKAGALRIPS